MSIYDIQVADARGTVHPLSEYEGQVLLIVNTATKCGFAPQFKGLQKLYDKYKDQGFAVLGFPSNQFANQEPLEGEAIAEACELNHGVNFPLYAKVDVKGESAHPLFKHLTREAPGLLGTRKIKWNFTKFLVGRDGKVIKRYAPTDTPEKIEGRIREVL
ncbi:glutathione peroxidase [Cohnella sp. JJ-181]|uniref:glutathione peroxidase n=1 Tax=Cohnella rhizoplanae TaxID=2974897 RepID=UPI0022FFAE13|nr:glutathione peroxidase [Cohnella sp. JJ-181]CAI6056759.1 Glutathione peroxidase BsaA [Cohnella sp. JJ-181]